MAGSEAPALRKPPATATPIRLLLPRQSPTLPFSATDPLQGLFASLGIYLEQALQPLEPHISRDAVRAFILETRHELDDLAACIADADMCAEILTVTEPGDKAISLEVHASLEIREP